jgi:hypothetical protein
MGGAPSCDYSDKVPMEEVKADYVLKTEVEKTYTPNTIVNSQYMLKTHCQTQPESAIPR